MWRNDIKCKYMFMFILKNLARKGLIQDQCISYSANINPTTNIWSSKIIAWNSLRWRHNGRDGIWNHQPHPCLLNRLFGVDQRKHQSSASLAFVWGIHRGPVNTPHKWPVTRKMFPSDDAIMSCWTPVISMNVDWTLELLLHHNNWTTHDGFVS